MKWYRVMDGEEMPQRQSQNEIYRRKRGLGIRHMQEQLCAQEKRKSEHPRKRSKEEGSWGEMKLRREKEM